MIKKKIGKLFNENDLKITSSSNLQVVDFLDVTLNLGNGTYYPFRKPNNEPRYVHKQSNHPPTIIKEIPKMIGKRISDISCNKQHFNKAKSIYQDTLKKSGYTEILAYSTNKENKNAKRNRQRKIIWFNPPFSSNVHTNVGRHFRNLISKHFPTQHKFHTIFNKNTVKCSYSCMPNMSSIINSHNRKLLQKADAQESTCNCRNRNNCPLDGQCLTSRSAVYIEQKFQAPALMPGISGYAKDPLKIGLTTIQSRLDIKSIG